MHDVFCSFWLRLCCISLIQPAILCAFRQIIRYNIEIRSRRKINSKHFAVGPFIRRSKLLQMRKNFLFLVEPFFKENDVNRSVPTTANDFCNYRLFVLIRSHRPDDIEIV